MGFDNSVALAQHVRRNLALWSGDRSGDGQVNRPEREQRRDKPTQFQETYGVFTWITMIFWNELEQQVWWTFGGRKRHRCLLFVKSMSIGRCHET